MAAKINEISQGVFLHKQQVKDEEELVYLFKIEVKRMNMVEFVADFTGSENVVLDGKMNLTSVCTIEPFLLTTVAKLILRKDWKLKSKFKYPPPSKPKFFKGPPKGASEAHPRKVLSSARRRASQVTFSPPPNPPRVIIQNTNILKKFPVSIMSLSAVQQHLISNSMNFVDSEFMPTDVLFPL